MIIKTKKLITKSYLDECIEYCCDGLQAALHSRLIFEQEDSVFNIINDRAVHSIAFCPFCGESLEVKIIDLTNI